MTQKEKAFDCYKMSLKIMFHARKMYLYEKYMERKTENASTDDVRFLVEDMNKGMWIAMQKYGIEEKNISFDYIDKL